MYAFISFLQQGMITLNNHSSKKPWLMSRSHGEVFEMGAGCDIMLMVYSGQKLKTYSAEQPQTAVEKMTIALACLLFSSTGSWTCFGQGLAFLYSETNTEQVSRAQRMTAREPQPNSSRKP